MILALDNRGSKKWGFVIPKNQTSINDRGYGLGTGLISAKGKLLVTFNSSVKNTNGSEKYRMNNVRKSNLVSYLFNESGEPKRQVLANSKQANFVFLPQYNFTLGDSLILTGSKGNYTSFIRLKF